LVFFFFFEPWAFFYGVVVWHGPPSDFATSRKGSFVICFPYPQTGDEGLFEGVNGEYDVSPPVEAVVMNLFFSL